MEESLARWRMRAFLAGLRGAAGTSWSCRSWASRSPDSKQPPADEVLLTHYTPARAWNEALPVGDGRLGAMVLDRGTKEKLLLNEEGFWSGEPRVAHPQNGAPYRSIYDLLLKEDGVRAPVEPAPGLPIEIAFQTSAADRQASIKELQTLRAEHAGEVAPFCMHDQQEFENWTLGRGRPDQLSHPAGLKACRKFGLRPVAPK